MTTASTREAALALEGLTKTFQGQQALSDVNLYLTSGEIHCLLGQNGSGKSTAIKCLAGFYTPDEGAIGSIYGEPIEVGSATDAHEHGVRFIHQDLGLIDSLTVADNLALGETYKGRFWLAERAEAKAAQAILDFYNIPVSAMANVSELGLASRTMVAIARAVHHGPKERGILVLDEPTAALAESDKDQLFQLLRGLRDRGTTILYVTHRLQEVFDLADRVTVLRSGRNVGTCDVADLNHDSLIELILGRSLDALYPDHDDHAGQPVLEVSGLSGGRLQNLDLRIREGEVVGIVGLTGSGAEDVPHLLFGSQRRDDGTVRVDGTTVEPDSPSASIRRGIAFTPGERVRLGGIGDWSIRENITLPRIRSRGIVRWLSARSEAREVLPYVHEYDIRPASTETHFASLSGGNQQKSVVARWMRSGARVFLLEEPTAGVDVGAKRDIYDAITRAAASGSAVLIATSDFEEAAAMCDRIVVMRDGLVGTTLPRSEASVDRLLAESIRSTSSESHLHA